MLPKVSQTANVEEIRDGGSWAAVFLDPSGHQYVLFLQVKHTEQGGFLTPKQHLAPVIIDGDPSTRPTPNHSVLAGLKTPITWEQARNLLSDMAANKPSEVDPRRSFRFDDWLREMTEVANREGAPVSDKQ